MCVCKYTPDYLFVCVPLSVPLYVSLSVSLRAYVCVCVGHNVRYETCEYKNKLNNISSKYTLPDRHCMRYTARQRCCCADATVAANADVQAPILSEPFKKLSLSLCLAHASL